MRVSGTDDERIDYVTPGPGPYYLRAILASDDAVPGNGYDLQVTNTTP
jgi:hypothetical protein